MTITSEYVRTQLIAMAAAKESEADFMQAGADFREVQRQESIAMIVRLRKEAEELRAAAEKEKPWVGQGKVKPISSV